MKNFINKKMAELKSLTVLKEAANNSIEVVIIILFVVVIVFAIGEFLMNNDKSVFNVAFSKIVNKINKANEILDAA